MDDANDELVDLSLFAESPTREHLFFSPTIPRRTAPELPWTQLPSADYTPGRRIPANKPLPPIPEKRSCTRKCKSTCDDTNRCILTRLKRCRTDGHCHLLQPRHQVISAPEFNLTVLPQRARPGSSMVWLEDEEVWLVVDNEPTEPYYIPPFRSRPIQTPSPTYYPPGSRSPIPDIHRFRSLPDQERLSPMFAEAMQTVPFEHFESEADADPPPSPPPLYQMERDSDYEMSWRESFHSALSGVSPITAEPSSGIFNPDWEGVARHWARLAGKVARPASALH